MLIEGIHLEASQDILWFGPDDKVFSKNSYWHNLGILEAASRLKLKLYKVTPETRTDLYSDSSEICKASLCELT